MMYTFRHRTTSGGEVYSNTSRAMATFFQALLSRKLDRGHDVCAKPAKAMHALCLKNEVIHLKEGACRFHTKVLNTHFTAVEVILQCCKIRTNCTVHRFAFNYLQALL